MHAVDDNLQANPLKLLCQRLDLWSGACPGRQKNSFFLPSWDSEISLAFSCATVRSFWRNPPPRRFFPLVFRLGFLQLLNTCPPYTVLHYERRKRDMDPPRMRFAFWSGLGHVGVRTWHLSIAQVSAAETPAKCRNSVTVFRQFPSQLLVGQTAPHFSS